MARPALAPLGTDDEAAGTPPTAGEIQLARCTEGRRPDQSEPTQGPGYAWIRIGFILSLFAGVAIWLLINS